MGLTIVAVGTGPPALATAVVATVKKMGDLAIGHIVGSHIFNLPCILGVNTTNVPLPRGATSRFDLNVMVLFSRCRFTMQLCAGMLLPVCHGAYVARLASAQHPSGLVLGLLPIGPLVAFILLILRSVRRVWRRPLTWRDIRLRQRWPISLRFRTAWDRPNACGIVVRLATHGIAPGTVDRGGPLLDGIRRNRGRLRCRRIRSQSSNAAIAGRIELSA